MGGTVPKGYIPGVEKGINSVMGSGVLAGFPVVDVKATLIDGAYHDVDSSALAFEIAARAAFREGLQKGGAVLLEPIMKVEVVTPEEHTGFVMGDLLSRRGHVQGQDMRANAAVINAMVPLANMFGYVNQLRSGTQGRASFTMHVFVRLLIGHADQIGELLLCQTEHDPPFANAGSDVPVDILGSARRPTRRRGRARRRVGLGIRANSVGLICHDDRLLRLLTLCSLASFRPGSRRCALDIAPAFNLFVSANSTMNICQN